MVWGDEQKKIKATKCCAESYIWLRRNVEISRASERKQGMEITFWYFSRGYLRKKYGNEADLFEHFFEVGRI